MINSISLFDFFNKVWQLINLWDTAIFLEINRIWTNPLLDALLPFCRHANTWAPLYLFLIVFVFVNDKQKAWVWLLFALVNVVITDQVSSHLIKLFVQRPRPCADPFLQYQVRLMVDHCSGGYSFTSSHATNHFGFATLAFFTFRGILKKWSCIWFLWAAIISYSQVYVGVHYPLDVICGAMLGIGIGYGVATLFIRKYGLLQMPVK